jgi:hypothetical protein
MIGQHMSLEYLIPLALDRLRADPLAEADYYPGDLLKVVLAVPAEYWEANREARKVIGEIVARAQPLPEQLHGVVWPPSK